MRRLQTTIFAALLSASTLVSPRLSHATEVQTFDGMATQNQADHVLQRKQLAPSVPSGEPDARLPQFTCGMTIVQANPSIDPLFAKRTPPGQFTMRAFASPVCREPGRATLRTLPDRLPHFFGPKR